jgi:hypothetical protein
VNKRSFGGGGLLAIFTERFRLAVSRSGPERKQGEAIMKIRNVLPWLVVIGCVTLTSSVYAQESDATAMASAPATQSKKATPADKKLGRDVRKALSKAPGFNVSNVFVKARGGAVVLSGSVPDGSQIPQATEVAKGVQGVTSVSNKLTLYSHGNN